MDETSGEFNPICKLCNNLDLPENALLDAMMMGKKARTSTCGSLVEFRQSAIAGCLLCSAIEQAVTYFADRLWEGYTPKATNIEVQTTIPEGYCAEITVLQESCEKIGNMEHLQGGHRSGWPNHPTRPPIPISIELCREKGKKFFFIFPLSAQKLA
jgi:hypothetical protein